MSDLGRRPLGALIEAGTVTHLIVVEGEPAEARVVVKLPAAVLYRSAR